MEEAVSVQKLEKDYQGEKALRKVTFSITDGCLFGIIGPDGAGKTTLLQILTTLIQPDMGDVFIHSLSVKHCFKEIRRKIGYMPQQFSLYEDLSVMENLSFFADIFGITGGKRKERMDTLFSFSRLENFKNRRAGNLSGGMKQKLALCCALIHEPEVLILDEPTVGVDPVSREEFWDILQKQHLKGMTIIVSTPYMNEASYCDELILLNEGSIFAKGTPAQLCEGYPLSLYATSGEADKVSDFSEFEQVDGIELAYPCIGNIHIASRISSKDEVLNLVRKILPDVLQIEHKKPDIEDVFMYTLSKKDNNDIKGKENIKRKLS